MTPYSRPKVSDLYTQSQSKLLENHTLYSGICLYSPIYGSNVLAFRGAVLYHQSKLFMVKTILKSNIREFW